MVEGWQVSPHRRDPVKYGENVWAAADIGVSTTTTTFAILQSMRLDLRPSGPLHP